MENRPNYLPATGIKFTTPHFPNEPSIVFFSFENTKMATVCYNILVENYSDGMLKIRFNKIDDKEIDLDFVEIKTGKWVTGCKIPFIFKEYQDFTDFVNEDHLYAVLFGIIQNEDKARPLVCSSTSHPKKIISFLGYSHL